MSRSIHSNSKMVFSEGREVIFQHKEESSKRRAVRSGRKVEHGTQQTQDVNTRSGPSIAVDGEKGLQMRIKKQRALIRHRKRRTKPSTAEDAQRPTISIS
ncbi:unnamed protein product, partial [Brassica oleracea]